MTISVADARAKDGVATVPLVVITCSSGAVLRFSDRVIDVGGYTYDSFLLEGSEIEESVERLDSNALNADHALRLRNEGIVIGGTAYASLVAAHEVHPLNGATVAISRVFVAGADVSPEVPLFTGAAEEPQGITVESLTLRCSSMPEHKARSFELARLEEDTATEARPEDYGKVMPELTGTFRMVEVLRARWGASTTLTQEESPTATTIHVSDTSGFPSSGTGVLMIGGERISYTGTTATTFTGCTRGYGTTTAALHPMGSVVYRYYSPYQGVIANHDVKSVTGIYGEFEGHVLKISGPTLVNGSYLGAQRARLELPNLVTVQAVRDDLAVDNGTLAAKATQPPQTRSFTRNADPVVCAGGTDTATFPAAPTGTFKYGKVSYKITVFVPTAPAPLAGVSTLSKGGVTFATVATSGIVEFLAGTGTVEVGTTSWATSYAWSSTVYSGVKFYIDELVQEGAFSAPGDPAGGTITLSSASAPNSTTSTGSVAYRDYTIPSLPTGMTSPTNIVVDVEFLVASTMQASGTVAAVVPLLQTRDCGVQETRYSNPTWYFSRHTRNGGRMRLYFGSSWPSAIRAYIPSWSGTSLIDVTLSVSKVTISANVTNELSITDPYLDGTVGKSGGVIKTALLDRVFVDGTGLPSDAAFFGTVSNAISRPDYVMKAWIVKKLGFAQADVDTTSFDAAGAWYASNSYALSVQIQDDVDPLATLYRMAFESRSIVWYQAGKWHLLVIPDTAPAAIKTIARADLAGKQASFTCGYTRRDDVRNVLTVRYNRNTGPDRIRNPWLGTKLIEGVLSGYQRCPETIDLGFVRGAAMASSVGALILKQRQKIYKTVEFPVFWDSTDLLLGDTVAISGQGFWDGSKFFLRSVRREGVNKAIYSGVEWW